MVKLHNFSKVLHHHPVLQLLCALFIISSIPFSLCEIRSTNITDYSHSTMLFGQFGFGKDGHVAISLKDFMWKSKHNKAEFIPSSMGFFLARASSVPSIMKESRNSKSFCFLSSQYVKVLFNFDKLTINSTYEGSFAIDDPDEYILVFGNCQPELQVSMYVHTEMYNLQDGTKNFLPTGQTVLPKFYFLLFLIYTFFFGLWIFVCIKQRPTVDKIHLIMGTLLLVKAVNMICASEDKTYVSKTGTPHGWDVAFYIFGFFKGTMLFTVIILIGTGWSFLKPYLQERERNILMTVIPLQVFENIAYVMISEAGPTTEDWVFLTWNLIFLFIDFICCCLVFFPIIWSIRNLQEASKMDGKAARNLQKLTLFKKFYACVVGYLYFTRILILGSIGPLLLEYGYEWVTDGLTEGASLAFYVFIFYKFQPAEKNPYLVIDDEEEIAAGQMLQQDDSFEL